MRLKVDETKCSGCGACAAMCPAEAIAVVDGVAVVADVCLRCMACANVCPEEALVATADPPPAPCAEVARRLTVERPHREQHTLDAVAAVDRALAAAGIAAEVSSRLKSPCSAQEKMRRRGVWLTDLHDLCGVRVVVDDVAAAYQALRTIHLLWPHLPEALDDYVAAPKDNGYQALHTVVRLPCGHTMEIQIRTAEQHRYAEIGPAAHWRYKRTSGLPLGGRGRP